MGGLTLIKVPGLIAGAILLLLSPIIQLPPVAKERGIVRMENFAINEQELEQNANEFLDAWFEGTDDETLYKLPISDSTIHGLWRQFSYERENALREYETWFKVYAKEKWADRRFARQMDRMAEDAVSQIQNSDSIHDYQLGMELPVKIREIIDLTDGATFAIATIQRYDGTLIETPIVKWEDGTILTPTQWDGAHDLVEIGKEIDHESGLHLLEDEKTLHKLIRETKWMDSKTGQDAIMWTDGIPRILK